MPQLSFPSHLTEGAPAAGSSQVALVTEILPANAGNPGSIPGLGRSPGEGNGHTTPVFLPGESHEQKSLVGYSP